MQLILRPVSDAQLNEIIVTDSRFAIGRNEELFAAYDRSILAKLSRRHARIFEREGLVYIADLHSSNGTTVNGHPVEGEPVQLQLSDEVQFGGLRYQVAHLDGTDGGADQAAAEIEVKVVLKPNRTDGSLKPIVISKFPFLVSRYSDAFARYQETMPQPLSFISKKHAYFFLQQNAVYIEDLGSTNGTYVSGEQLDEQARKLSDGDTIAFGGDRFVYAVQLFIGREKVVGADAKIGGLVDGTIFVDDSTNFFEIYMDAGDEGGKSHNDETDDKDAVEGTMAKFRRSNTRVGRALRFFDDLRGSLRDAEPIDRRLRWTIIVSLACFAVGVGGYWYLGWPVQKVSDLYNNQEYLEAAVLANDYLNSRPDDERLQELATEATLKALVPEWQQAIGDERYAAARQTLTRARQIGLSNPKDDELIAALELATEFSAVEAYDGRDSLSIEMLADDATISALVNQWDSRQTENARALSRVELQVDGFNVYQAEFFSKLRALRKRDRDLEPIFNLRSNVVAALADRDAVQLREYIREFAEDYPDTEGLGLLHEDLRRYEAVEKDIGETRWLRAYDQMNQIPFNTAPFAQHVAVMNENVLPDARTREGYATAVDAWKNGDTAVAFELLGALAEKPWGEVADRELARNRDLFNTLAELQTNRDAADFADRMFNLYGKLDPGRDIFLRRALQPDFQRHSQAALDRAADRTRSAEQAWKSYDNAGRLRSVHRLEERVSPQYRNLARLLTLTYQNLRESASIYQQLGADSHDSWALLNREVIQEIKLQTGALEDLLVIEPEIRKAKLKLLPSLSIG
jgi:pSer/pThr/pTyr-binding forkhead associated (FHA) protein